MGLVPTRLAFALNDKSFALLENYWSITKSRDIKYVDSRHNEFWSEPKVVIGKSDSDFIQPHSSPS